MTSSVWPLFTQCLTRYVENIKALSWTGSIAYHITGYDKWTQRTRGIPRRLFMSDIASSTINVSHTTRCLVFTNNFASPSFYQEVYCNQQQFTKIETLWAYCESNRQLHVLVCLMYMPLRLLPFKTICYRAIVIYISGCSVTYALTRLHAPQTKI